MTIDHYKLNQLMTLIAAAIPDVVLLLEQINTTPGTWYAVIDLANIFFSIPLYMAIRNNLPLADKARYIPSVSYFRFISAHQSYVTI